MHVIKSDEKIRRLTWSTSDGSRVPHRTADRTRGRTPRSRLNRTAIAVRSSRDRTPFCVESERQVSHMIGRESSQHPGRDWCSIEALLWRDRGWSRRKTWRDCGGLWKLNWSETIAKFKPRFRTKESPPLPLQHVSTTAPIAHDFGPISLFKNSCTPSLFFNFWSIREGIKRISRKISSSSWSPRV